MPMQYLKYSKSLRKRLQFKSLYYGIFSSSELSAWEPLRLDQSLSWEEPEPEPDQSYKWTNHLDRFCEINQQIQNKDFFLHFLK